MKTTLVTGATGFVGSELLPALRKQGWRVRAAVRSSSADRLLGIETSIIGDLAERPDLGGALEGVDAVIHLAGRAHVMNDRSHDPETEFRRANVVATRHLAEQAAACGVRRFVFLSSVKAQGEATQGGPMAETDEPRPLDAYGRSKLEAEHELRAVERDAGLEVAILRPPLVYGPGVKANFLRLIGAIGRGIPLPLGAVDNRRSLVGVWNLCDLILRCATDPSAAGETFLVSDGEDLSTPELIRTLAEAMERPARLVPVPPSLLLAAGRLLSKAETVERLVGSLQVDSSKAARLLDWTPPVSAREGLARTARWYLESRGFG